MIGRHCSRKRLHVSESGNSPRPGFRGSSWYQLVEGVDSIIASTTSLIVSSFMEVIEGRSVSVMALGDCNCLLVLISACATPILDRCDVYFSLLTLVLADIHQALSSAVSCDVSGWSGRIPKSPVQRAPFCCLEAWNPGAISARPHHGRTEKVRHECMR